MHRSAPSLADSADPATPCVGAAAARAPDPAAAEAPEVATAATAAESPEAGCGRPWLLADIGGTNARFGFVAGGSRSPEHVLTFKAGDHDGPAAAARAYLAEVRRRVGAAYVPPRSAAFAVATAVAGDLIDFTNSGWRFSRQSVAAELGLQTLRVLNDFEALALSLPHLTGGQLRAVGPPAATPVEAADAARAVIGPGTGLGVGGLLRAGGRWVAVPGEGGHATLAPADDFDSAVLAAARRQFPHVSAERLLSGIGLPVLHQAVAAVLGETAPALAPDEIVARALDPAAGDRVAAETVNRFCALLGTFAGSVALTLGARGGVYIGGGIVPRLGARFDASAFRRRFEAKGRFEPYLKAIPTFVITDTLAALAGAASALEDG